MWRRCECPRFTLPVPVFLKRLAAPLCVFNFGIVPRNQPPVARRQFWIFTFNCSGQSARLARVLTADQLLSLRNWIWNRSGGSRCQLLLAFWRYLFRNRRFRCPFLRSQFFLRQLSL